MTERQIDPYLEANPQTPRFVSGSYGDPFRHQNQPTIYQYEGLNYSSVLRAVEGIGFVPFTDVGKVLQSTDFFWIPSQRVSLGNLVRDLNSLAYVPRSDRFHSVYGHGLTGEYGHIDYLYKPDGTDKILFVKPVIHQLESTRATSLFTAITMYAEEQAVIDGAAQVIISPDPGLIRSACLPELEELLKQRDYVTDGRIWLRSEICISA